MAKIQIDLSKKLGKIKPMHAGGQPPISGAKTHHFHFLTEAGIPYSRLHDVGGSYGGYRFVDIPNIFRDFDADENDPASYDFAFTDTIITGLINADVKPYYRLGVTIENDADIKAYRIFPPKDFSKWARICEHIIAHYNEGWADGFHYDIEYWEIWNEPDDGSTNPWAKYSQMWTGTPEEFYELYDITAKHLKKCFPNIKIGGYGSCGLPSVLPESSTDKKARAWFDTLYEFFHGFFRYISEHNSPIDFFSWHSYYSAEETAIMDDYIGKQLTHYGYSNIETHLNEWNWSPMEHGMASHAAKTAAVMLKMQNCNADMLMIYDMRMLGGTYNALFDGNTQKPFPTYYDFVCFSRLYRLGTQVELSCDESKIYAVAASNGKRHAIMLSNVSGEDQTLEFSGAKLENALIYVTDSHRCMSWAPNANSLPNNAVMLIEWE